jgi:hypothetical protein
MSKDEQYKGHDLRLEIWGEVMKSHPGAEHVLPASMRDLARWHDLARLLALTQVVLLKATVKSLSVHC